MRFYIFICVLLCSSFARAADISVVRLGPDKPFIVIVRGDLNANDTDHFRTTVSSISRAIVAFDSDGGSVVTGIEIGELIRLRGFYSAVLDDSRCVSACALAWLGGIRRFMSPRAKIGFHAAYDDRSGTETGVGNALVGAYLNKIGLSYSAVIFATQAAPKSMTWLTPSEGAQRGIFVDLIDSNPNNVASRGLGWLLPTTPIDPDIARATDAWLKSLERRHNKAWPPTAAE